MQFGWYKTTGKMLNYKGQPPFVTYFYVDFVGHGILYYEFLFIEGLLPEFLGHKQGPKEFISQWEKCEPTDEVLKIYEEVSNPQ